MRADSGLLPVFAAVARHDVGGDGRDFERDEDQQQLDGGGHEHHADGAELDEGEEFAEAFGLRGDRVEDDEQRGEHDAGDEDVEEALKASVRTTP